MVQQAYLHLREGIIRGEYRPGSRLREQDVSDVTGMSRVPVREALRRLEGEGFVATYPNRGAVVRGLTMKDVAELFDLRLTLEVLGARLAARRVADGHGCDLLQEVLGRAAAATAANQLEAIQLANTEFHGAVIETSGNHLLITTMKPLLGRIRWLLALTADRDMAVEYREHVGLFDAISQGNPELAAAIAFAHIEHGRRPSLEALSLLLPAD